MKYFGSRLPVLNFFTSKLLFTVFNFRLWYLRFRNSIRAKKNNEEVLLINNETSATDIKSFLREGYDKLNIGGGPYNISGFVNIDFQKFSNVERSITANILDLSFIPDKSISHIYSNQVLEHLTEDEILSQLSQYKRIVKTNGVISFRTPNSLGVCYGFWFGQYPESDHQTFLNLGYPSDAFFYDKRDGWYHKDLFALIHWLYADAGNIKNQHLSILTPSKIKKYLISSGYDILAITEPECSQIIVIAKPND